MAIGNSNEQNDEKEKKQFVGLNYAAFAEEDDGPDQAAFLQIYAALMILLMTFFIVIYSMTAYSQAKFQLAKKSLHKVFETIGIVNTDNILTLLKSKELHDKKAGQAHRELVISLEEISEALEEDLTGCNVSMKRFETTVEIPEGVIFAADGMELSKKAQKLLDKIIKYVKDDEYTQLVIGAHYFSVLPEEETNETNNNDWMTSSLRALIVAHYCAEKDIDYERLSAIGFGNQHPRAIDTANTSFDFTVNNRIEIVIKRPMVTSQADDFNLVIS